MPRYAPLGYEKSRTITVRLTEGELNKLNEIKAHLEDIHEAKYGWKGRHSLSQVVREAINDAYNLNLDKSIPTS